LQILVCEQFLFTVEPSCLLLPTCATLQAVEERVSKTLTQETPQDTPYTCKSFLFPIVALVIVVSLLVGGCIGYYLGKYQSSKSKVQTQPQSQNQSQKQHSSTTTSTKQPPKPEVDSTEGWEVYTSSDNTYQFKYPSNWSISRDAIVTRFLSPDSSITVSAYKNSDVNQQSLENLKDSYAKSAEVTNLKDTIVGGRAGFTFEFTDKPQKEIIIAGDNNPIPVNLVTILINYQEGAESIAEEIFNQILSTFKFLE